MKSSGGEGYSVRFRISWRGVQSEPLAWFEKAACLCYSAFSA